MSSCLSRCSHRGREHTLALIVPLRFSIAIVLGSSPTLGGDLPLAHQDRRGYLSENDQTIGVVEHHPFFMSQRIGAENPAN
jgi:hypothetical protein